MNQSLPTEQPQPNQPVYGAGLLDLFTESLDRAAYEARFGEQAPDFDKTLPIKKWKDDSFAGADTSSPAQYIYYKLGTDGKVHEVAMNMTAGQAAKVNLTGAHHYPPYAPAPTHATLGGWPVDPLDLSTKEQAVALAIELGRTKDDVQENTANQPFQYLYPPDELRKVWEINYSPMLQLVAGRKINQINSRGIGVPYHWVLQADTNQEPVIAFDWPDTGETGPVHPQLPIPQRRLKAGEEFLTDSNAFMSGQGFVVHRTDMAAPSSPAAGISAGGGMTAAQDHNLQHVVRVVDQILALAIAAPPAA